MPVAKKPKQTEDAMSDAADRRPQPARVSTVEHAIAVLKMLPAKDCALGVNEIARRVGLHKSTVSRLLATLERHGFVARSPDNGGVSLGISLVALASPLIANMDLVKAGRPILDRLADECGETVSLSIWTGDEAVMVEQTMGARAVTHIARHGGRVPGHCTASGKVLLANLPAAEQKAYFAKELVGYTPNTIVSPEALRRQFAEIRARGYAINDQEYDLESCGVAAGVRNARGAVISALAAAVPKHRFSERHQAELVRDIMRCADELSARMGYSTAGG